MDEHRRIPGDNIVGVAVLGRLREVMSRDDAVELLVSPSCLRVSLVTGDGDSNADSNMSARHEQRILV